MIALEEHPQGTVLPIKAQASARRNALRGVHAGNLQVSVTQAPDKGKANKAIIALVAQALELRKSNIQLLSGHSAPLKRLLITGLPAAELLQRLENAVARHQLDRPSE